VAGDEGGRVGTRNGYSAPSSAGLPQERSAGVTARDPPLERKGRSVGILNTSPSGRICAALPYRSNGHDTAKWRSFRVELCHTRSVGKIAEHREAVLAAVLAGAGGSIALMLRAGHRQSSRILVLLFGLWVLSPFVAAAWVHVVSKRWPVAVRARLYLVMLVLTVSCLALYASVAFGYLRAKVGFVFLVVPLASWLVVAIAVSLAVAVARNQSRRGDGT
jgi:hypothetical protein